MSGWQDYLGVKKDLFRKAVDTFGTPFFFLDGESLEESCRNLVSGVTDNQPGSRLFFPYKTNSLPLALNKIHGAGIGAEVSSSLEILQAARMGVSDILYYSPAKSVEDLVLAFENNATVVIDSMSELGRVIKAASLSSSKPRLGLRVNFNNAGEWSQFGVPVEQTVEAQGTLWDAGLFLEGIHFHIGSWGRELVRLKTSLKRVSTILSSNEAAGLRESIRFIDVGGGFPSTGYLCRDKKDYILGYLEKFLGLRGLRSRRDFNPRHVDVESVSRSLADVFKQTVLKAVPDAEMWLEPGRSLVNTSMHLLSRVVDVKESGVFIDAGINLLPTSIHENQLVYNLSKLSAEKQCVNVYGPLCMSNDLVSTRVYGGMPREGDVLVVLNTGAYNISWSIQFSKPLCRILTEKNGRPVEARVEEDLDYRLKRDVLT